MAAYTGFTMEELLSKTDRLPSIFNIIIDGIWNGYPISDKRTNQRFWLSDGTKFTQLSYNEFRQLKNKNYKEINQYV